MRTALKLDDRMGVIQARDLSKHQISSASEGIDLVKKATASRMVGVEIIVDTVCRRELSLTESSFFFEQHLFS